MTNEKIKRVLVVDDEDSIRKLMADIISRQGYEVLVASDGQNALHVLGHEKEISLIVTDLVMPELNGIDLILTVMNSYPHISIIAISGGGGITGRFDYLPVAKLIGAKCVVNKPFSPEELAEVVNSQLR